MRAGLDRHPQPFAARGAQGVERSGGCEMNHVDVHAVPAREAIANQSRRARSPVAASPARCDGCADRRRPRRPAETPATPRAPAAAGPGGASAGIAARRSASPTCSNSSTPNGDMKHLKPSTPRARGARAPLCFPAPPLPEADVDVAAALRRLHLGVETLATRRSPDRYSAACRQSSYTPRPPRHACRSRILPSPFCPVR